MLKYRIAVQLLFFILFLVLTVEPTLISGGEFFFRVDAIGIIISSLSSRIWTVSLLFSAGLVVFTLFFGRAFCGWACPMGAIQDVLNYVFRTPLRRQNLNATKYILLLVFIAASLVGFPLVWVLDPIVISSRIAAVFFAEPATTYWFYLISAVLIGLHIAFGRRAFCRILCPLGATLGIVSRFSFFRRRFFPNRCTHCNLCVVHNSSYAIGECPTHYNKMECFQCKECVSICPVDAIDFDYRILNRSVSTDLNHAGEQAKKTSSGQAIEMPLIDSSSTPSPIITRRHLLSSLTAGAATAYLLSTVKQVQASEKPLLLPAGALPEDDFLNKCIRCLACVRACPTQTLAPSEINNGIHVFQAPVLVAREGGCLHDCNACGESCPTGAIEHLPLTKKQSVKIGQAAIDEKRCLPYTKAKPCLSCYASCPHESIYLESSNTTLEWGDRLLLPRIDEDRCTGCGLCEARCPLEKDAAIKVEPNAKHTFNKKLLRVI